MQKRLPEGADLLQIEGDEEQISTVTRMLRVVTVVSGTVFYLSCPVCGCEDELEDPENGQLWDCRECGEVLKIKIKF